MKRWLFLASAVAACLVIYFFFYGDSEKFESPAIKSILKEADVADPRKITIASNRKQKSADELSYETASDLSLIADDIKSKAEAGDPVAQRIYGKMLEECWRYSISSKTFKADLDGLSAIVTPYVDMYQSIGIIEEKRCKNFTSGVQIHSKDPYLWYALAGIKKDPQSTAKLLSGLGAEKLNDQALKEAVDLIIASKDPEALLELANTMGAHNQSRSLVLGKYSGSDRNENAWRLAACQLGANCRAKTPMLINLCRSGARSACTGSSLPHVIQRDILSPADYERVINLSNGIVNEIAGP